MKFLAKLRRNEKGATAIEYGLIAALIAVALITTLTGLGTKLNDVFSSVEGGLEAPAAGSGSGS